MSAIRGYRVNAPNIEGAFKEVSEQGRGRLVPYVFSMVGTSRCDVRAACSGATPWNAIAARIFVPPVTTRAGTAQRAIPNVHHSRIHEKGIAQHRSAC